MALENKLGITDSATLARTEEKLSKEKAVKLFESFGVFTEAELKSRAEICSLCNNIINCRSNSCNINEVLVSFLHIL